MSKPTSRTLQPGDEADSILFTGVNKMPVLRACEGVGFRYSDYRMLLLNAPVKL